MKRLMMDQINGTIRAYLHSLVPRKERRWPFTANAAVCALVRAWGLDRNDPGFDPEIFLGFLERMATNGLNESEWSLVFDTAYHLMHPHQYLALIQLERPEDLQFHREDLRLGAANLLLAIEDALPKILAERPLAGSAPA